MWSAGSSEATRPRVTKERDMKDFDEREMWQMEDDRLLAKVVGGLWIATGIVGLVLVWVVWG